MTLSKGSWGCESVSETLIALAGPDETRAAQLIVLAALWHDELAAKFARHIKSELFDDDLLHTIAEYSVGSMATFGVTDLQTIERLLRLNFTDLAVTITTATIHKIVELIEVDDVRNAIKMLSNTARAAA